MKFEYKEYSLTEIMDIISGGTPRRNISEFWGGDIPWASVKDFNNDIRRIFNTEETITTLGLEKSNANLLDIGSVIISARGTVGALAQLARSMAFNQSCYGLIAKPEIVTSDFLYYLMRFSINNIKQITHGAVFDTITRNTFEHIKVSIPPLREQQKISNVLSSLDGKIELNQKMNQTLEEMAQAIFKEWFIDFRFPGYEKVKFVDSELGGIPESFEVLNLEEISEYINRGIVPRYSEVFNWSVINQRCIRDGKINVDFARGHGANVTKVKQVIFGDVLINSTGVGTLGRVAPVMLDLKNYTVDTHVTIVRPKEGVDKIYFGQAMLSLQSIFEGLGFGSTGQTELRRDRISTIKLVVPRVELQKEFSKIVSTLKKYTLKLLKENVTLVKIRDVLLPKLMNGEIDVSKLEVNQ